ncbi:LysR family transcriptional regulator [Nocardia asteroides]|uniref:LysR family transcriptional regulator n=1 Tax=Nocardia asteroides TaxID=1824 RepID=UPI00341E2496
MPAHPDLNLTASLFALLEERHVSRAAQRLGVSQPAASAMLARLRRHFGDQLLERVGNRYELTPLGRQLREQAGGVVRLSESLFATKSRFDPATSEREFVLTVSDYMVAVLGPTLAAAFEAQAPHAVLRLRQFGKAPEPLAETTARSEDGLIAPHSAGALRAGMAHLELFSDEWVAVVDRGNPIVERPPALGELSGLRWVLSQFEPGEPPFLMRRLVEQGVDLRPQVITDSFVALPLYVVGTDRVGIVQRRLATAMALPPDLRLIPCPFEVGPINEALWWHSAHTHDSGHRWLRDLVSAAANAL